jgi:hypothetical protein
MRRLILPAVAALAWAAAARAEPRRTPGEAVPAPIVREVSARAVERGIPAVEALAPLREAAARGVPVELVAAKVLEGISKGVPAPRISAVARDLTGRLALADDLLREARGAGLIPPSQREPALLDLAAALGSGVGQTDIEALLAAAHGARGGNADSVVSAAAVVGEPARRDVPRSDAMALGKAIARQGPRSPGEIASLFDAWRAEGGKDPHAFVSEAARRVESGRKLEGMVDVFGESSDRVVNGRGPKDDADGDGLAGSDVGKHGAEHGLGPGQRPDTGRGAVPGLEDTVPGKGKGKGKNK